jgi:ribosomal protein S18 acetylase RimI-like enzyme
MTPFLSALAFIYDLPIIIAMKYRSVITYAKGRAEDSKEIATLFKSFRSDWSPLENFSNVLEKSPAFVAKEKNKIVGFVYSNPFAPEILELWNIYVHGNYRLQNIGSTLTKKLEEAAFDKGYKAIILTNSDAYETKSDKKPATDFYLQLGYSEIFRTASTRIFIKHILNKQEI